MDVVSMQKLRKSSYHVHTTNWTVTSQQQPQYDKEHFSSRTVVRGRAVIDSTGDAEQMQILSYLRDIFKFVDRLIDM